MVSVETGKLPLGIELRDKVCKDYTLRPLKVKDSLMVGRSEDAVRCQDDDEMMGLALLARRLTIDGVPQESMTLDFMLELYDEDLAEIMKAEGRLSEELARFRGKTAQAVDPGPAADRGAVGEGRSDAARRGPGVAGGLGRDQESEEERADAQGAPSP